MVNSTMVIDKPAPKCPGCGADMKPWKPFALSPVVRYSCDCGWHSPWVDPWANTPDVAYVAAMKRNEAD